MRHVDRPPPAVLAAFDDLVELERRERRQLARFEQSDLERRADRHQLEHASLGGFERLEPGLDQLAQPHPRGHVAAPAPDTALLGQRAPLDSVAHQLTREQRVAPRQLPERVAARSIDRSAQRLNKEALQLIASEGVELEPGAQLVLPQGPQRIRRPLAPPDGDHGERLARRHELVQQCRRGVVEQLAVVDAQHQPVPAGALRQSIPRARQQLGAALRRAARRGRQQCRERPERDRRRRARGSHPLDGTVARCGNTGDLYRQPRLADAGGAHHDHAAGRTVRQQLAGQSKLTIAPHERPGHTRSLNRYRGTRRLARTGDADRGPSLEGAGGHCSSNGRGRDELRRPTVK